LENQKVKTSNINFRYKLLNTKEGREGRREREREESWEWWLIPVIPG
jgi:hypothetical protein